MFDLWATKEIVVTVSADFKLFSRNFQLGRILFPIFLFSSVHKTMNPSLENAINHVKHSRVDEKIIEKLGEMLISEMKG